MRAPRLLSVLAAAAGLACASGSAPSEPGIPGTPLGRSAHPRSGSITWDLRELAREGDLVTLDLEFLNGRSQAFRAVSARLTLHGPDGEQRDQDVPVGPLRQGGRKRLRARVADVPFPVKDVTVELLYAVP
jgi:hypothetical protein